VLTRSCFSTHREERITRPSKEQTHGTGKKICTPLPVRCALCMRGVSYMEEGGMWAPLPGRYMLSAYGVSYREGCVCIDTPACKVHTDISDAAYREGAHIYLRRW
jgi:hypothetical protein